MRERGYGKLHRKGEKSYKRHFSEDGDSFYHKKNKKPRPARKRYGGNKLNYKKEIKR